MVKRRGERGSEGGERKVGMEERIKRLSLNSSCSYHNNSSVCSHYRYIVWSHTEVKGQTDILHALSRYEFSLCKGKMYSEDTSNEWLETIESHWSSIRSEFASRRRALVVDHVIHQTPPIDRPRYTGVGERAWLLRGANQRGRRNEGEPSSASKTHPLGSLYK